MNGVLTVILLALAGAVGAVARYFVTVIGEKIQMIGDGAFLPWPTFLVNVIGSFLLGFLIPLFSASAPFDNPTLMLVLGTGFCGALTTMSAFILEAVTMFRRSQIVECLGYLLITLGSTLGAVWLGVVIAGAFA